MTALSETKPTLPSHWYYDPEHYARELNAIWYRDWICVGRSESLSRKGEYFVANIGTQSVIVTRQSDGEIRAYHNTCRHRGSRLCADGNGRFSHGRIVCPYHAWTYSLEGKLKKTPGRFEEGEADTANYSLYQVHVELWRGFIFINLSQQPETSLVDFLGEEEGEVQNWPLESMRTVHQETFSVACNWKIFWENYSECYHCAKIHPELCKVMPLYAKGVFDFADLPGWTPQFDGDKGRGGVGGGARTWTVDGAISLPVLEGPTEQELERGVVFSSFASSLYVVGHPDYVRSVRMMPTGPESIELVVDWLLPADYEAESDDQLKTIVELARLVVKQDGEICEQNQQGLRCNQHKAGVLVPEEYELWEFHESVRRKLEKAL